MELFKLFGTVSVKIDEAKAKLDEIVGNAETSAQKMNTGFGNACQMIGGALTNVGNDIQGVGYKIQPLSEAAGKIFKPAVSSASDFMDGMAKVSTLVDTSQVSISDLSSMFLDLSDSTGMSAVSLAEAGYQALSASVPIEQLGDFSKTAGNLAKVGFTEASTAVDVLTTAINAYGLEHSQADKIANQLINTQNRGKTSVAELASSMGKIIPTAAAMNVNLENLETGYVQLTKQGIATAESTTYMNGMLNELGKSSTDVGKILKQKTGKSFQDLMADGADLYDVLDILKTHADENGTAFNELWGSAEAGKAALAILNAGGEEWKETLESMVDVTDLAAEGLEKLSTPSDKANRAMNRVKNSSIRLGESFLSAALPAIEAACGLVEKLCSWFNNLSDGTKTVISVLLALATAASPVLITFGRIIAMTGEALTTIGGLATKISAFMGGFSSAVSSAFSLILSPIGAVIAIIAVLVGAFMTLWNTNEGFRTAMIEIWNSIVAKVTWFINGIIERFNALGINFDSITQWCKDLWMGFCNFLAPVFIDAWNYIATAFGLALDVIMGLIDAFIALFSGDWDGFLSALSNLWTTAWQGIQNLAAIVWQTIQDLFGNFIKWIADNWQSWLQSLQDLCKTVWEAIKAFLKATWEWIKTTAKDIWDAIKKFLAETWDNIKKKTEEIWNAIKSFLSGLWDGVKQKATEIWNAIKNLFSETWNAIKSTCENVWNAIKSFLSGLWDGLKQKATEIWNAIKQTVLTVCNAIKSTVDSIWNGIKTTITNAVNGAKNTVVNTFNEIKNTIESKINAARDAVSSGIDAIRNCFNFSWSLPHLALPHFTVSGSFSLNPPSVPSFGISWYKKAMEDAMIMNGPTIFGFDPQSGTFMGGGEAGSETIVGTKTLQDMISYTVAGHMDQLAESLDANFDKMFKIFETYFPEFAKRPVIDKDSFVKSTVKDYDRELGKLKMRKGR